MSGLSLERLLFDPADPTVGPMVGAYQLGTWSATVSASDLDIRDLAYATDSVTVHIDSTDNSVKITDGTDTLAIDSSGYITANINGTVTVSASDLDIRDLAHATDSVTAYQGGTWTVTSDDLPNIVPLSAAISVTSTATALPTTPLTGRKRIQIQNVGSEPIEIGKSTVTYGTGLVIPKGATETIEAGPSALFYGIAASGKTVAVRILEW